MVLTECIPNSAELQEGRLSGPLSENSDFWKDTPESALEWGADELDLPPPVPSLKEEETEVLQGADLLRASGTRL